MYERRLHSKRRIWVEENLSASGHSAFLYLGRKSDLLNSQSGFCDHLTSIRSKDVSTKDTIGFSIGKDFDLNEMLVLFYFGSLAQM